MTEETGFSRWYRKNRGVLSDRRKEKYKNDPVYREQAKTRSKNYRQDKASAERIPAEYTHTLAKAAEALGVSISRIRDWGAKGYYPSPKRIRGYFYFTDRQIGLIRDQVKTCFDRHGTHTTRYHRDELDTAVSLVFANWE